MIRIASSSVFTHRTDKTGPKISFLLGQVAAWRHRPHLYADMVVSTSTSVGPTKFPSGYSATVSPRPSSRIFPPSLSTVPISSSIRLFAIGEMTGPRSAPGSKPPVTLRDFARSIRSGMNSRAGPTKMAPCQCVHARQDVPTDRAMHRWPAAPNAAPATTFNVRFLFAANEHQQLRVLGSLTIGHDHSVILGPEVCLDSLPLLSRPVVYVRSCAIATDKRDRFDVWMVAYPIHCIDRTMYPAISAESSAHDPTHTLMTPGGIPALSHSSAMIIVAPGSRSDGFTTRVLPVTVASAALHRTILPFSSRS